MREQPQSIKLLYVVRGGKMNAKEKLKKVVELINQERLWWKDAYNKEKTPYNDGGLDALLCIINEINKLPETSDD